MLRTSCRALAALAVCVALSACSESKQPEPKRVSDRPPDSRLKGPEKDMGMGGAVNTAK